MTAYELKEKIAEMIEAEGFDRYIIAIEDTEINKIVSSARYSNNPKNLIKQAAEVFTRDISWNGAVTTEHHD